MKAHDFTRNDCQLGKRRQSYDRLTREYRCEDCGGRLVMLGTTDDPRYPANWHVACVACDSHNFIHERQAARQQSDAIEVLAGLPKEMRDLLQPSVELPEPPTDERGIFSLSPIVVEL